ncbi:hypothetical protein WBJ53_14940 [Spirosoma sp. SC4-14]|uniref:hypothetical protein n=1 Tax=Spirosoma sp. SC4-14 TaxID=3128900 RepID=UPI0030CD018C
MRGELTPGAKRAFSRLNDPVLIALRLSMLFLGVVTFLVQTYRNPPVWLHSSKVAIIKLFMSPVGPWLGGILLPTLGLFLLWFKLKQQFWYGFVESVIAVVACIVFTLEYQAGTSTFLKLMTALYLCVRGYNNMYDGRTKNEKFWLSRYFGKKAEIYDSQIIANKA